MVGVLLLIIEHLIMEVIRSLLLAQLLKLMHMVVEEEQQVLVMVEIPVLMVDAVVGDMFKKIQVKEVQNNQQPHMEQVLH